MATREEELGFVPQRENAYNKFLPRNETLDKESGYTLSRELWFMAVFAI
jgi:hypothetical protein